MPRDQPALRQRHLRGVVHGLSVIHLAAARRPDRDRDRRNRQLARHRLDLKVLCHVIAALIPDLHVLHVQAARARARLAARQRVGGAVAVSSPGLFHRGKRKAFCRKRLSVIRLAAARRAQGQADAFYLNGIARKFEFIVVRSVRTAAVVQHDLDQIRGNGIAVRADRHGSGGGYAVFVVRHALCKGVCIQHYPVPLALKAAQLPLGKILWILCRHRLPRILHGNGIKLDLQGALVDGQPALVLQSTCIPIGRVHCLAKSFLVHDAIGHGIRARARIGLRAPRADDLNGIILEQRAVRYADQLLDVILGRIKRCGIVRFRQIQQLQVQMRTLFDGQRAVCGGQIVILGHVLAAI